MSFSAEEIRSPRLSETLLVFGGIVGFLKLLYELRGLSPLLSQFLPALFALVLVYVPLLYLSFRKTQISFFEKGTARILSSIFTFALTSLVIFPPFLLLNHFYQQIVFSQSYHAASLPNIFQLILIQILLVAFPEEFFYRGTLQTLLGLFFKKRIRFLGTELGWNLPLASLLFAASHSLMTLRWWHFAIFFPSLVFGWLREKTGGLVAPILFHAFSNMVVAWIGASYF